MCKTEKSKDTAKKKFRLWGRSSALQNNSLEVCLIGLAPSENAIARKFTTVWVVDTEQKNSQQKLNELKRQDFAD